MYLVAVVWIYVASMMALAEATSTTGTVLGAVFTFVLYGLGPVSLVVYLLGTPARRRARKAAEALALAAVQQDASRADLPAQPDGGRHAPGHPVAAERKEP
ncbi:hypothetical protein [Caldimonas tepidiphila]|uniref:hypothetical protein n=1 Tax=Caldimonas tepidiphila TaxID=2315841 RepID=UPI000E5BCC3A|nr:hypothetical protein [Caldimonas tepidiphila]